MRIDRLLIKLEGEVPEAKFNLLIKKVLKTDYDINKINSKIYLVLVYDNYLAMTDLILSIQAASEDIQSSMKAIEVPYYSGRYLKLFDYVPNWGVVTFAELVERFPKIIKEDYSLLKEFDYEMLLTVKLYLELGKSPSLTAERLYVHRNTVTYRVERFKAKTGLELEISHVAIYVYRVLVNYLYDFKMGGNINEEI